MEVLPEIAALSDEELTALITEHSELIVSNTQGESWDDPEEWQSESVDLAHAIVEQARRRSAAK